MCSVEGTNEREGEGLLETTEGRRDFDTTTAGAAEGIESSTTESDGTAAAAAAATTTDSEEGAGNKAVDTTPAVTRG